MATLTAKKNAKKAGTVSVTLSNKRPAFDLMVPFGEQAGRGLRAKLDAATALQTAVADGVLDVSTDELRDAAIKDAAAGYDEGQFKVTGKRTADKPMETLRSEFGSFIRPLVLEHASAGYAMIADIIKGKDAKSAVLDQFQQRLAVNRAITAAKGAAPKAELAKKLLKKAEPEQSDDDKRAAAKAGLVKDAQAVLANKLLRLNKAQKDAIAAIIAAFS